MKLDSVNFEYKTTSQKFNNVGTYEEAESQPYLILSTDLDFSLLDLGDPDRDLGLLPLDLLLERLRLLSFDRLLLRVRDWRRRDLERDLLLDN